MHCVWRREEGEDRIRATKQPSLPLPYVEGHRND